LAFTLQAKAAARLPHLKELLINTRQGQPVRQKHLSKPAWESCRIAMWQLPPAEPETISFQMFMQK
jgi:hypothetical protein